VPDPKAGHIIRAYGGGVTGHGIGLGKTSGAPVRRGYTIDVDVGGEWSARVDSWEQVAASPAFRRLRDALLERARPAATDVILDLGCGAGLIALAAAPLCARVYALDASSGMLGRLSDRAEAAGMANVELILGDMRRIPLPDASVDVVVSSYALHHLGDDGKELAVAEAVRVLRPGGRVVVVDMMFQLSMAARDRRIVAHKVGLLLRAGPAGVVRLARNGWRIAQGTWEKPASVEWWQEMLERRGLVDVDVAPLEQEAGLAYGIRPTPRS
jgi:ubiquinone/menaquinone biosynthesis C-methylase UbiE